MTHPLPASVRQSLRPARTVEELDAQLALTVATRTDTSYAPPETDERGNSYPSRDAATWTLSGRILMSPAMEDAQMYVGRTARESWDNTVREYLVAEIRELCNVGDGEKWKFGIIQVHGTALEFTWAAEIEVKG